MEEVKFHFGNDGALGGIAKAGFDNGDASRIRDASKLKPYYTVTMLQVLERMNAPVIMDYLSLDVEGMYSRATYSRSSLRIHVPCKQTKFPVALFIRSRVLYCGTVSV